MKKILLTLLFMVFTTTCFAETWCVIVTKRNQDCDDKTHCLERGDVVSIYKCPADTVLDDRLKNTVRLFRVNDDINDGKAPQALIDTLQKEVDVDQEGNEVTVYQARRKKFNLDVIKKNTKDFSDETEMESNLLTKPSLKIVVSP